MREKQRHFQKSKLRSFPINRPTAKDLNYIFQVEVKGYQKEVQRYRKE